MRTGRDPTLGADVYAVDLQSSIPGDVQLTPLVNGVTKDPTHISVTTSCSSLVSNLGCGAIATGVGVIAFWACPTGGPTVCGFTFAAGGLTAGIVCGFGLLAAIFCGPTYIGRALQYDQVYCGQLPPVRCYGDVVATNNLDFHNPRYV